ncbi:hypothetical protein ACOM2C_09030 [Pseudarthrobacter sp. So.54]
MLRGQTWGNSADGPTPEDLPHLIENLLRVVNQILVPVPENGAAREGIVKIL